MRIFLSNTIDSFILLNPLSFSRLTELITLLNTPFPRVSLQVFSSTPSILISIFSKLVIIKSTLCSSIKVPFVDNINLVSGNFVLYI